MVDKKRARYNLKRLHKLKTWQLVCLLILSAFVSSTFLRLNNIGMVERRTAVLTADSQGDAGVTKSRLYDLQVYITSHMNTDIGKGVYLESTYKKDVQAAYEAASNDTNPNGNIYKLAQDVCRPQFDSYSYAYIQCTVSELAKYPSSSNLVSAVQLPRADAYLHDFVSPLWSPDFAGWSVLISVVILIIILFRAVGVIILKIIIHRRYSSV